VFDSREAHQFEEASLALAFSLSNADASIGVGSGRIAVFRLPPTRVFPAVFHARNLSFLHLTGAW
jgi:hypothetical protein